VWSCAIKQYCNVYYTLHIYSGVKLYSGHFSRQIQLTVRRNSGSVIKTLPLILVWLMLYYWLSWLHICHLTSAPLVSVCICLCVIIRPHCSTTYVDAAYCYWPSSVVCRSVCRTSEPCKNGWTNQDALWVMDSGGPKEPCIKWGTDPPWEVAIFRGRGGPM